MEKDYFQELNEIVQSIYPPMAEHYISVVALLSDPKIEEVDCVQTMIDNHADISKVQNIDTYRWEYPENFLSAEFFERMCNELPNDSDLTAKLVLEEWRDMFHQLESPDYVRGLFMEEENDLSLIEDVGETIFCTSQPCYMRNCFRQILDEGITSEIIKEKVLAFVSRAFIYELLGKNNSNNADGSIDFTCFIPDTHNEIKSCYETLVSTLLTTIVKEKYSFPEQHFVLKSGLARCSHTCSFKQFFYHSG